MTSKEIGKRIKLARIEQNLTQTQLAKKLNVTQKVVSHFETGRSRLSVARLIQIGGVLKKSVGWFLED